MYRHILCRQEVSMGSLTDARLRTVRDVYLSRSVVHKILTPSLFENLPVGSIRKRVPVISVGL